MIVSFYQVKIKVCAAYLHPEEEPFGTSFELQHKDPSGGALVHPFELTVIREDDQILNQDMKSGYN